MADNPLPFHLTKHFLALKDPRIARTRRHNFLDLLLLTIISVLCGADNFVEIERFAKANQAWFETFLALPAGIPSHDTIARVLSRLEPKPLSDALLAWAQSISIKAATPVPEASTLKHDVLQSSAQTQLQSATPKVYAIDGKCLRSSFDRVCGQKALHLVSLYCTRYNVVLAQQAVDQKSNEQTAIEPLIEQIDVTGAILTLDAMHTQKQTTRAIRRRGAHYVIGLKTNQERLYNDVAGFFTRSEQRGFWTEDGEPLVCGKMKTHNVDHGRYETREYVCAPAPRWLEAFDEWSDLKTIIRVDRTRTSLSENKTTTERSYYISSLPAQSKRLPFAIRSHWGIENGLHWILDIAYDEDHSRARRGHEAENLATIRRFTLSALKADHSVKVGIKAKRKMAGWDPNFRNAIVNTLCI